MGVIEISIESSVKASPEEAWEWITSLQGISGEMSPYFRMTAPAGVTSINDVALVPGKPLFRSRVFLFCILPIDYSDITLVEINKGSGFIEQSPMGSMKLWRHDRRIVPAENGCRIVDHVTFEPRWASPVVGWFIRVVFRHRHRVLQKKLRKK